MTPYFASDIISLDLPTKRTNIQPCYVINMESTLTDSEALLTSPALRTCRK
jgi:hypothetical protein